MKSWMSAMGYWLFVTLVFIAPVDVMLPGAATGSAAGIAESILREHVRFISTLFVLVRLSGENVRVALAASVIQVSPLGRSLIVFFACSIAIYITVLIGVILPVIACGIKIAIFYWLITRYLFRHSKA